MAINDILKVVPIIQSATLVDRNLKLLKKKKKANDLIKTGVNNLVGISLIKTESDFLNS